MDISNKSTYYNSIYQAVIVNIDEAINSYQIYVPAMHSSFDGMYKEYIKEKDKENSIYKSYFPWASSMIKDLQIGDIVFIGFLNNEVDNFIILGKDQAASETLTGSGEGEMLSADLLALAVPIIIRYETGIFIKNWPDDITNSQYGKINGNDNGAWSIGLIQWRATRAYELCFDIAKRNPNWKTLFPDKDILLVKHIEKSLLNGKVGIEKMYHSIGFTVTNNSKTYKGIQNLLISEEGKKVQQEKATQNIGNCIDILKTTYNLSNPALIIFLADIMNQYGTGVNNARVYSYLRGCIDEATKINNDKNLSYMQQLEKYYSYWLSKTKLYISRRSGVKAYIIELEKQGKLSLNNLVDMGKVATSKYIPELGEYLWPVPSSDQINCYWGTRSNQLARHNAGFKYHWAGLIHGGFHSGIDIGPQKNGVDGDPVIATGDGKVVHVNGGGKYGDYKHKYGGPSQGNCIILQMNKNPNHFFAYMHLCKSPTLKIGDRVKAGQVVGYMGNTGNSTGTHLHLGLHIGKAWPSPSNASTKIDPLPYLGRRIK